MLKVIGLDMGGKIGSHRMCMDSYEYMDNQIWTISNGQMREKGKKS